MGSYRSIHLNQTSRYTTEKSRTELNYNNLQTYYHGLAFLGFCFSLLVAFIGIKFAAKVYAESKRAKIPPPVKFQVINLPLS